MREIIKVVKEKLVAKYLKDGSIKNYSKRTKKFKPRIKARLRKNKQIIGKNIGNFFDWIKGAELVELKECNTKEDPVRPELDNTFRRSYGRKIFGLFVILGVFFGSFLAAFLKTKYLVLFFSIVVFIFGAFLLLQQENSNKIKPRFSFFPKAVLGFISGSISAPMGITGAMMNVPILRFFGYPITKAIGSAAAIGWIISISGTIAFFSTGLYLDVSLPLSIGFVNIPAFLIFIPITTIMARIGVNTVHKMSKIKAQRMFGVFLYVIGTIFIFRYFSL